MSEGKSLVLLVIEGKPKTVGNIAVARVLPVREHRTVGPFVFLDHMGPVTFAPGEGFDVKPHPHIGLSTVTYLLEGEAVHRDSLGVVQTIRPGELNLMTAGRGVVHSERSGPEVRARGATLEGLQLWLGLPSEREEDAPTFEHRGEAELPSVRVGEVSVRVMLGEAFGARSPVEHPSKPLFVDLTLPHGAKLELEGSAEERAIYVASGEVGLEGRVALRHSLIVLTDGASVTLEANGETRAFLLGGPPLVGRRYLDWNFVASSREALERAKAAWRADTFPKIPGDDQERVPLPELG